MHPKHRSMVRQNNLAKKGISLKSGAKKKEERGEGAKMPRERYVCIMACVVGSTVSIRDLWSLAVNSKLAG